MIAKNVVDIISISGTVIGAISLVISIFTFVKASNIENALNKQKITQGFRKEYSYINKQLKVYCSQMENKDISDITIHEIHKLLLKVKLYAESDKWRDTKKICEYCDFINSNYTMLSREKSRDLQLQLTRFLHEVITILEKEGQLHDVK